MFPLFGTGKVFLAPRFSSALGVVMGALGDITRDPMLQAGGALWLEQKRCQILRAWRPDNAQIVRAALAKRTIGDIE